MSSAKTKRLRKPREERRAEILAAAAEIALTQGLERVTLRAVADSLGVQPGLINHYFPAAEDLVVAAFARAASEEREDLVPAAGSPMERIARFASAADIGRTTDLSRLWLNARHLSRFIPGLAKTLEEQQALDSQRLLEIIRAGIASGDFAQVDPADACVRIWMAVDGRSAHANGGGLTGDAYTNFVTDATEWALGLQPRTLRAAVMQIG